MKAVFKTDIGKMRHHNEDSGGVFPQHHQLLAVVADGMGGHRAGDIASQMTLAFIEEKWQKVEKSLPKDEAIQWLNGAIQRANQHLYEHARNDEACKGMGTTIVAMLCQHDFVVVCHVGDSRGYFLPKGESIEQITEDHTLVNELVKSGQLSKEDAEYHPKKHMILRALGTEPEIEVETSTFHWSEGAQILLCSDGLTNKLTNRALSDILSSERSIEAKAGLMIDMANDNGGEDNITLTLIEHAKGDSQ